MNARSFLMYLGQIYIVVGMLRIYIHVQFSRAIGMKKIIHFEIVARYNSLVFGGFIM